MAFAKTYAEGAIPTRRGSPTLRKITGVGIHLVASLVAWGESTKPMVEKIAAKPLVRADPRYPHLEAKTLGEAWGG